VAMPGVLIVETVLAHANSPGLRAEAGSPD
jgi:hypothetical protein